MNNKFFRELAKVSHKSLADGAEYKGNRKDIELVCEYHGKYTTTPDSFFNSYNGCDKCKSHKYGLEFIQKAKKVHGDKYIYNIEDYVCSRTKMRIFCTKHNDYFPQRPSIHLQGQGCDVCGNEDTISTKRRNGVGVFIDRARELFGNTYKYMSGSYTTTKSPMKIICPVHGNISITPDNHLKSATGCKLCDKEADSHRKTEEFKIKLEKLRPKSFDMSKVVYVNNTTRVKLKCLEHDEWFSNTPLKMLDKTRNVSCKTCGKLSNNRWTIEAVRKIPKIEIKTGYLYVGKISNIEGVKIGVCEDLNSRLSCYQDDLKPYPENNFEYLYYREMNYLGCFVGEEILKKVFREYRYAEESIKFGGYTEMFSIEDIESVISVIESLEEDDIVNVESIYDPNFISLTELIMERLYG